MNNNFTFLVTYFAQPEFLRICLDSIRKFHPDNPIIVSQQEGDESVDEILNGYDVSKRIEHNMRRDKWVDAAMGLAEECQSDAAVYIEHDAFLLRGISDMIERIRRGEHDAIGVEEMTDLDKLNRHAPGMMNQNFFMLNMDKMKLIGIDKMRFEDRPEWIGNKESGYGISQSLENKLFLPITASGYGHGTYYGDIAHHFWYGSYPKRHVEQDDVNRLFIEEEATRLIRDYWNNEFK